MDFSVRIKKTPKSIFASFFSFEMSIFMLSYLVTLVMVTMYTLKSF